MFNNVHHCIDPVVLVEPTPVIRLAGFTAYLEHLNTLQTAIVTYATGKALPHHDQRSKSYLLYSNDNQGRQQVLDGPRKHRVNRVLACAYSDGYYLSKVLTEGRLHICIRKGRRS